MISSCRHDPAAPELVKLLLVIASWALGWLAGWLAGGCLALLPAAWVKVPLLLAAARGARRSAAVVRYARLAAGPCLPVMPGSRREQGGGLGVVDRLSAVA